MEVSMDNYQIGAKIADVFSDLGTLAMKPVKAVAKGLLGLVTVLTFQEGKAPKTTAEKIGAKAREWKSKIDASDRPTHLGSKIKVLFGSIREKFAPARKVLVKEGPLTEGQAKLAEATREIDPFIAGFDIENRDVVRALYFDAKSSSDPDHHGKMMDAIANLKITGWKREHLRELGKTLSAVLLSREQADPQGIEALRHARQALASTPIKVKMLIKDVEDQHLYQTIQILYYTAELDAKKMGVEKAVAKFQTALLDLKEVSDETSKILAARLRADHFQDDAQKNVPDKSAGDTLVKFAEKPQVSPAAKRSVPPLSQENQEALDAAAPFLSNYQKDRIVELAHRARQAIFEGDEIELKKSLKFLRDHCHKGGYEHAEHNPALEKLYETIQSSLQKITFQEIAAQDRYSITAELLPLVEAKQLNEDEAFAIRRFFLAANKDHLSGKISEEKAVQQINEKMKDLLKDKGQVFSNLSDKMAVLFEGIQLMPPEK